MIDDLKDLLYSNFEKDLVNDVLSATSFKRLKGSSYSGKRRKDIDYNFCGMLHNKYKLPIYKIAMLYGVSDVTIAYHFKKNNINSIGHKCGKNSYNDYFENIDSIDKAYFLGFIYADGNICQDRRSANNERKIMQATIKRSDGYLLETFNKLANFNANIQISHKNDKNTRVSIAINSSKVYDDLYALGVRERKSTEGYVIPSLKKELIPHFIRGYYDGDGIANKNGYIGFCGAFNMLSFINDYLHKQLDINDIKITYNKSNGIYYMLWTSRKDVIQIFNLLYNDKQNLYLKRKYIKIKNVIRPSA